MNELIIWDTDNKEWTVLCGNKSYVVGEDAVIDPRNIEAIVGVDIAWMDGKYKRVEVKNIPESIIKAIKARA